MQDAGVLRTIALGGYIVVTRQFVRSPKERNGWLTYELRTDAGALVARGNLEWPTSRRSSELESQSKRERAIDSDASIRAVLHVIGHVRRASSSPRSEDYVPPSESLLAFYDEYDRRIHRLADGTEPLHGSTSAG